MELPASSSFGFGFVLIVVMLSEITDGGERLTEPQSCGENNPGNTYCSLVAGILNLSFLLHTTRRINVPTLESTCFIKREAYSLN